MPQSEPLLTRIAEYLKSRGISAYVVGGAVRDRILSLPQRTDSGPGDIDLSLASPVATRAEEFADQTGATAIVMGDERGHVRLIDPGDERNWIDLTGFAGDLEADLDRRDFTVNAMAVPLEDWLSRGTGGPIDDLVIDPNGGMEDLRQRVIRETNPGNLLADPVRVLRAVRFATQLEFDIESATAAVLSDNRDRLTESSPERIRDEFFAMMSSHRPEWGIRELDRLGLLEVLLPELTEGRDFVQRGMHYFDVMEHGLHALEVGTRLMDGERRSSDPFLKHVPWRPEFDDYFREIVGDGLTRAAIVKMVAMLHDIGKPGTMTLKAPSDKRPNGRVRFLGHGELGAQMATNFLARLRCSKRLISHVSLMIDEHLRPFQMSDGSVPPTDRAVFRYFRDVSPVAVDTVMLSVCDYAATSGPLLNGSNFERYSAMLSDILARGLEPEPERTTEDLFLNGYQVQERFGLQPGPEIGRLLGALRDGESSGAVRTKAEAYELLARLLGRAASRRGRP